MSRAIASSLAAHASGAAAAPCAGGRHDRRGERGQALLVLVAVMGAVLVLAVIVGGIARGLGGRGDNQRAADLGALGGARAMRASYHRLFAPAYLGGRPNPLHLSRTAYLSLGRARALATARLNGAEEIDVAFPDGTSFAPTRIRVTVLDRAVVEVGGERSSAAVDAVAEAELAPTASTDALAAGPGDYSGPLAYRQGKPMRPDVAVAFDRLAAAAAQDGVSLIVNSGWRSTAEQARLFAANPDPRWVAPPGRSLHRLGTELDLGPPSAYGWLAANAPRFHFVKRYAWEPWHHELTLPHKMFGMDEMPLFVGYPRVSFMGKRRLDAEDFHAVRDQVRAMQQEADRLGVRLEISEPDLNAKGQDVDREEIIRIWEGVESGRYQGVLVAYLSRLTRSTRHALELWERTRAAGGRVIAIREGIDSANMTPHAWFILKVMSGAEELKADLAREDFDARRANAVAAGVWPFRQTPTGYSKDKQTRRLVPNDRADDVRWARRAAATGTSISAIADRLGMTAAGVAHMIRNRVYLGELHVGGRLQKRGPLRGTISPRYSNLAAHPPLFSHEEWAATEPASNARPARRPGSAPALLGGLVRCAACGHVMSRSNQGRAIVYTCHGRSSAGRCPAPAAVTTRLLDEHVEPILIAHLRRLREHAHRHDRSLADDLAELDAARAELAAYLEMVEAAGITLDEAAAGARRRKERARAAERRVEARRAQQPITLESDPVKVYLESDVPQRNRLSRSLIETVVVARAGGRGSRTPLADRVRVIAHGADVVTRYRGGGRPHGIRPIPLADLDDEIVLRV